MEKEEHVRKTSILVFILAIKTAVKTTDLKAEM